MTQLMPDPWPLHQLVLETPRLQLRPDDDAGLSELIAEAHLGVHPPELMPFGFPWTDVPPEQLGGNMLRYYWDARARHTAADWQLNFLVRLDGVVIGTQGVYAKEFAITREVHTGSWIGMRHQGNGYGTEMRAAVLQFVFDHLDATAATTSAFTDNAPSNGVTRHLGYEQDGFAVLARRGARATMNRYRITVDRFADYRPQWTPKVAGLDEARPQLVA